MLETGFISPGLSPNLSGGLPECPGCHHLLCCLCTSNVEMAGEASLDWLARFEDTGLGEPWRKWYHRRESHDLKMLLDDFCFAGPLLDHRMAEVKSGDGGDVRIRDDLHGSKIDRRPFTREAGKVRKQITFRWLEHVVLRQEREVAAKIIIPTFHWTPNGQDQIYRHEWNDWFSEWTAEKWPWKSKSNKQNRDYIWLHALQLNLPNSFWNSGRSIWFVQDEWPEKRIWSLTTSGGSTNQSIPISSTLLSAPLYDHHNPNPVSACPRHCRRLMIIALLRWGENTHTPHAWKVAKLYDFVLLRLRQLFVNLCLNERVSSSGHGCIISRTFGWMWFVFWLVVCVHVSVTTISHAQHRLGWKQGKKFELFFHLLKKLRKVE